MNTMINDLKFKNEKIYEHIRNNILSGGYPLGMKLPTELVFARELQPFFYSDETALAITVKTMHGIVHAAAYKTADGKVKVLVTGNGLGESESEITLTGTANLKSRYCKTEPLGGGKYRFKDTDICSDVLEK